MNQEDVNVLPNKGFQSVFNSVNGLFANPSYHTHKCHYSYFISRFIWGFRSLFHPQTNQPTSSGLNVIEIIMLGLLIFLVLINGLQYFYGLDAKTSLHNLFKGRPTVDVKLSPESKLKLKRKIKHHLKHQIIKKFFILKKIFLTTNKQKPYVWYLTPN